MPVNVDKNLTLKNNTMDASYGELFKKLNVAYGWTNTQTTSSGGTAVLFNYNNDIITNIECDDINKCILGTSYGTESNRYTYIINGKLYVWLNSSMMQIGEKTNYRCVGYRMNNISYAIDTDNKLWYIDAPIPGTVTETQIGESTTWEKMSLSYYTFTGLNDGKIYSTTSISSKNVEQRFTDLTNVTDIKAFSAVGNPIPYGICINNGILYKLLNNGTYSILDSTKKWTHIYPTYEINYSYIENSLGEVYSYYYSDSGSEKFYNTTMKNCKYICHNDYTYCTAITNDNKLLLGYNFTSDTPQIRDISNGMEWTSIISNGGTKIWAIGDGKLYCIQITYYDNDSKRTVTYTQLGTESNYQKVEGSASTAGLNILLAWTGDATTVSHTVLTTKSPQANDKTYIDEDLTIYSTVQSVSGTTITDGYRTYDRDASKDTSFTAIPPATIHETVSTVDFLRITNPNT